MTSQSPYVYRGPLPDSEAPMPALSLEELFIVEEETSDAQRRRQLLK
eukprot:gene20597-7550_t